SAYYRHMSVGSLGRQRRPDLSCHPFHGIAVREPVHSTRKDQAVRYRGNISWTLEVLRVHPVWYGGHPSRWCKSQQTVAIEFRNHQIHGSRGGKVPLGCLHL